MNPYKHALLDEYYYQLNIEKTLPIHTYMDSSKIICGDNRHRVFFHNSYFPYISHLLFGYTITNENNREISVKDITEKHHILADFKNKFIPTINDYFEDFNLIGDEDDIIKKFQSDYLHEFTNEQIELLMFPYKATGKIASLLMTHNHFWLTEVMPKLFKDYNPKLKNFDIHASLFIDRLYYHNWINNAVDVPKRLKK